ncbi:MAG: hypothetical protein KatS3mg017_1089 [Fimbriimonadales bacterium]|nr:MAG: hypothetical protein KatS3mg017_1089 [Fimbriimonadales bacterium]GIV08270.1 MAG: hypothetical protein KatS3mg019_0361 [Fimbriimonadales bacterium]
MRHKETWELILLVLADSLSTYWLITQGFATEFNPIMNWFIQISWGAFFAVKFLTLGMAVGLAEWYRRRNPMFVRRWLRFGFTAYLTIWLGGAIVSSWIVR